MRLTDLGRHRSMPAEPGGPAATLRALAVLAAGAACMLALPFAAGPVALVALLAGGAVLFLIAALPLMPVRPIRLRRRGALAHYRDVLEDDAAACLLCEAGTRVFHANPAAVARLGAVPGASLGALLRTELAHPAAILERLQRRAAAEGRASEDVIVGDGALRISVRPAAPGVALWRLEAFEPRRDDPASVPVLTIGRHGVVLAMNAAARCCLGRRVRRLSDLAPSALDFSGAPQPIVTAEGPRPFVLRRYDTGPGRSEVALLPESSASLPQLGSLLDRLPIALLRVAPDGAILSANAGARRLLGVEAGPLPCISDLMEGLGRPIPDWLGDAAAGRGLNRAEFLRLRRPDAEVFVQITLSRVDEDAGPVLIAVLNDATELKTLEAQFVQSQKMQAIGQLAGGIAHDFNNLLTAISGHCDLLLLRHDRDDPDFGDLVQINQNANRAAALVGQLLAFSRKQTLRAELLDLRETLSDLTHLLNRLVGEKIVLELRHDPALPSIRADRRQLEQVMMNLVVNARDAMPDGGRILIETESVVLREPLRRDRAEVEPGAYVVVKVIDDGHGIAPDKISKVFEPFYTTKRTGEGTGLGLSTVYGIVKQTGGFVFLDSEVGRGTCFRLMFPAHAAAVVRARPLPPAPRRPARGRSGVILLTEDEAPVRAFASRALRLKGFTVVEADSGEEALRLLSDPDLRIDLFVSDVIMPGMDGPTWVRAAREARPDVPAIFVSGYAEDAIAVHTAHMPHATFLQKPFSLDALAEAVRLQIDVLPLPEAPVPPPGPRVEDCATGDSG
ncbi:hybrid sensor histidine kinase/response regulator [Roseivivax isoporae]|uniref:histidine kinase n=1 Tax=Roseivivax isoporae LMG 25204 TaxID=1449351 RepID=X7F1I7_9RHOB|nr:PAS domain-containing hybrid sensor histidine kinase/response regulator [Roseivivax isoporae]ETX26630.1 hypothetical protein RISW2_21685 [Roseivivax isoporae LMG 25204]